MKKALSIILLFTASIVLAAPVPGAKDLIQRMEDTMRGKSSAHSIFTMTVKRPRWDREMTVESWEDRKKDASFLRILKPDKDTGTAFLKANGAFRQHIPRIRRTIRISRSMMLQSWMGSDFSNDDLARDSSYSEDYNYSEGEETACSAGRCYKYTLTAKEGAPVVWPRLDVTVQSDAVPFQITFYNNSGEALKQMEFADVKSTGGILFPHLWTMKNLKMEGHATVIRFLKIEFNQAMSPSIFTEKNLTKGK